MLQRFLFHKICVIIEKKEGNFMELINQTLIMSFLGIIAASCVVFPILFLVQKHKQHKKLIETLKEIEKKLIKPS